MGADSVHFYYGVRKTVPLDDEDQLEQLEERSHPLCNLARNHKLHFTWGRLTDGADYFILIGHEIGRFGIEGVHEACISEPQFSELIEKTKLKLKNTGIDEPPAFYVQLHGQY